MPTVHDHLSEQFQKWERRGRGWRVFDQPVYPEPPFVPFAFHSMTEAPAVDDGRRPGFLGSLLAGFNKKLPPPVEPEEEPKPAPLRRDPLVELQVSLPADLDIDQNSMEQFFRSLALCNEPVAFELLGTHKRVLAQFAASEEDVSLVRKQLSAHFPDTLFREQSGTLEQAWDESEGDEAYALEFGLEREFMLPLATGKLDPFISIVSALAELRPGELALFQVLFQPVSAPWAESVMRSVTDVEGNPLFVNSPELTSAAEAKVEHPLYVAVVRMLVRTASTRRLHEIAREFAGSLRAFANPQGNALIPLHNDGYPFEEHIEDVLRRQSRRSGMILNSDELFGFVHLPTSAVRSPALQRQTGKTKAAPIIVRHGNGLLLGNNEHAGELVEVRLTPEQRVKHCHIIGATGTGKSTLLFNLIRQDIESGEGVAVLDPDGDLVNRILGVIPPERIDDVILVDPADELYSVGFNILSAHSELEKTLLASDLVAVFQRLSTSWGDQMTSVLQNAILAFLESDRRGTLADLQEFLVDPAFRKEFLKSVKDFRVVNYWEKSFPHLGGNKSIGSIITRLDMFLSKKPIYHMVSQPENRLDFAHIMDSGKIFLVRLPEGLLGKENSHLLGTFFVAKFQQIIMSRQAQDIAARRDYWIYLDEFAHFITPSVAQILTGARKYRIGLTLAHHDLQQLQSSPDVASAVMTHPYTRIVCRVGDNDAKKLGEGFAYFEAKDLQNLAPGQAIARVERSDYDFNLSVTLPVEPDQNLAAMRRQEVIAASRKKYGTLRADVEAMAAESRTPPAEPPSPPTPFAPVALELPKVVEVPKVTVSEKEKAVKPRDLGKGGAQHQAVQQRIKEATEALGFRCVIEKQISGSGESVDLYLERGDQKIACEISFTTTIDHEVGNVTKCLKAGFSQIAIICVDVDRLRKIETAVSGSLGSGAASVSYYQPDPFIAHLKTLPTLKTAETIHHGYKVKRSVPKLTAEEQRQREETANRMMAEAMRPKR